MKAYRRVALRQSGQFCAALASKRAMRGHTLIELSIASALSTIILVAMLGLLDLSRRQGREAIDRVNVYWHAQAALGLLRTYGQIDGYGVAYGTHAPSAPVMRDRYVTRYRADAVSVWQGDRERYPADCEGIVLTGQTARVVEAHFTVQAIGRDGRGRLHCSSRGTHAGQPVVESIEQLRVRNLSSVEHVLGARARGIEVCVLVMGQVRRVAQMVPMGEAVDCDGAPLLASARVMRTRWALRNRIAERAP